MLWKCFFALVLACPVWFATELAAQDRLPAEWIIRSGRLVTAAPDASVLTFRGAVWSAEGLLLHGADADGSFTGIEWLRTGPSVTPLEGVQPGTARVPHAWLPTIVYTASAAEHAIRRTARGAIWTGADVRCSGRSLPADAALSDGALRSDVAGWIVRRCADPDHVMRLEGLPSMVSLWDTCEDGRGDDYITTFDAVAGSRTLFHRTTESQVELVAEIGLGLVSCAHAGGVVVLAAADRRITYFGPEGQSEWVLDETLPQEVSLASPTDRFLVIVHAASDVLLVDLRPLWAAHRAPPGACSDSSRN